MVEEKSHIKACLYCHVEKPLLGYRVRKDAADGHDNICLDCEKKWHSQHYKKNKDRIDKRNKEWAKNNPDKCRALQKKYYYKDPKKHRKSALDYWYKNRDRYLQRYKDNKPAGVLFL